MFIKEKLLCAWHCSWYWENIGKQDPVSVFEDLTIRYISVYEMMMMILLIIIIKSPGIDESSWVAGTFMNINHKTCQGSDQKWHKWNSQNMIIPFSCLRFSGSEDKILVFEAGQFLKFFFRWAMCHCSALCKSPLMLQHTKLHLVSHTPFSSSCC